MKILNPFVLILDIKYLANVIPHAELWGQNSYSFV